MTNRAAGDHNSALRERDGVNAATRKLGIDRTDAQRAVKIDGLSDEAKQAARETGLDTNQSALLRASPPTPR